MFICSKVTKTLQNNPNVFRAYAEKIAQASIRRDGGNLQLIVPLTTKQRCSFPLRNNQNIRQLIQDIRVEDPTRESVMFTDLNGNRLSHSTTIQHLLKHPFVLKLDTETFQVAPPQEEYKQAIGNLEVEELTNKVYFQKIKERILSQKRHFILYSEFVSWCDEYGISEQRAREFCSALHTVGDILYFPHNDFLKDYILLSSKEVMNTVVNALDIKLVKRDTQKLKTQLNAILEDYTKLNDQKLALDHQAASGAKWTMRTLFAYICVQFGVMAHMVWVDFNWDIMEPISYFVGLGTTCGAYWYFILFKQDYTYDVLEEREKLKKLRKLYIKNEFDYHRWFALNGEVTRLAHEIGPKNIPEILKRNSLNIE
jgi:hypothetical protein